MKNVLIIYNYILHYRKPLFNMLSEKYHVTVIHSGNETVSDDDKYEEIIVPVFKFGPLYYQKGVLPLLKNGEYDIVIALFDVRWLSTLVSLLYKKRTEKFIWWGAWITGNKLANATRIFLTRKAHANIFYTAEARNQFIDAGVRKDLVYVANNTFDVGEPIQAYKHEMKNRILFVGSLDERKQIDDLIQAFQSVLEKIPSNILLTIIGEGSEQDKLKRLVQVGGLENRVLFIGKITDVSKLRDYYRQAIFSVSYGQAGLTVLQSLGYGVPFVTKINAISGGEKSNIQHNQNGYFCEASISSLASYIVRLCNNLDLARSLGRNAHNYYQDYCTMSNMNQGFLDAIENTRYANVDDTLKLEESILIH